MTGHRCLFLNESPRSESPRPQSADQLGVQHQEPHRMHVCGSSTLYAHVTHGCPVPWNPCTSIPASGVSQSSMQRTIRNHNPCSNHPVTAIHHLTAKVHLPFSDARRGRYMVWPCMDRRQQHQRSSQVHTDQMPDPASWTNQRQTTTRTTGVVTGACTSTTHYCNDLHNANHESYVAVLWACVLTTDCINRP